MEIISLKLDRISLNPITEIFLMSQSISTPARESSNPPVPKNSRVWSLLRMALTSPAPCMSPEASPATIIMDFDARVSGSIVERTLDTQIGFLDILVG